MTTTSALSERDPKLYEIVKKEEEYQKKTIRLIASENYVSKAVLEASGTVFTNKYSEGYPGARYYQGQENCDAMETLAIERAKKLFGVEHVNVQPYSGSPANFAVYAAFCKPGDMILSLDLNHGGHLTHGSKVSMTGKWFNAIHYHLNETTGLIDYEEIRRLAMEHKPKMIIAGHSAYPRTLNFATFRNIADECGAVLFVDMAHIAGLVAGRVHPSPSLYADVITTTTHKTLRGPRGAMIMCKSKHAKLIDKAVFPGLQGGPHNSTTAAIATALLEASDKPFRVYALKVVNNAKILAGSLKRRGFELVTGGTENHLILVDLSNKGISGKVAAVALEKTGIIVNCNTVPGETRKANDPSGIRLGTAAVTSRNFGPDEMEKIGEWIERALKNSDDDEVLEKIRLEAEEMCSGFPVPGL